MYFKLNVKLCGRRKVVGFEKRLRSEGSEAFRKDFMEWEMQWAEEWQAWKVTQIRAQVKRQERGLGPCKRCVAAPWCKLKDCTDEKSCYGVLP